METRTIKTCQGLQELILLNGALLPVGVDLFEVPSIEVFELLEVPRIPPEMIEELNRIMEQAYLMTLPRRPSQVRPFIQLLPID